MSFSPLSVLHSHCYFHASAHRHQGYSFSTLPKPHLLPLHWLISIHCLRSHVTSSGINLHTKNHWILISTCVHGHYIFNIWHRYLNVCVILLKFWKYLYIFKLKFCWILKASLVAQLVKNPPPMRETWVRSLGWEDPLENGKATHSSILAWRIPWTVQSTGSQRAGHDWATFTLTFNFKAQQRTVWKSTN